MWKLISVFAAGAALCVATSQPSQAQAVYVTGNQLKRDCNPAANDDLKPFFEARCMQYILGVNDGVRMGVNVASVLGDRPGDYFLCVPNGVEVGQLVQIVKAYLDQHPEDLHKNAAGLVTFALTAHYRCS